MSAPSDPRPAAEAKVEVALSVADMEKLKSLSFPELDSVKVLSFDLDDTIWNCMPVLLRAHAAQQNCLARNYPELAQLCREESHWEDYIRKVREEHQHLLHDFTFQRKQALKNLASAGNHPDPEQVSEKVFEAFITARNDVVDHIFPGVMDCLRELKTKYTLVSITNGNANVDLIPELKAIFDHSITAEQAGSAKPHAAPFDQMLQLVKVEAHEVIHIGDSIHSDVNGAKASGMHAIWINRKANIHQTTHQDALVTVQCVSHLRHVL